MDEILVIGHALNEVDMPYFKYIFSNLKNEVKWKIYCYSVEDKEIFRNKILNLGEKEENIEIIDAKEFWK